VYKWCLDHFATAEDREKFLLDLEAPLSGADPDRVPERVVNEEMSMFHALARQTSPGGA